MSAAKNDQEPTRKPRAGGRSARVRESVLDATYGRLLSDGYEALSISSVAVEAGVHETSIYRRWGTKPVLVMDACLARMANVIATPDTGSLRTDMLKLASQVARLLQSPEGRTLGTVILATRAHPENAALARQFWSHRFELAHVVFERAAARGEIDAGLDPDIVLELLVGPLYFRALVSDQPLSARFTREVVDLIIDGLRNKLGAA